MEEIVRLHKATYDQLKNAEKAFTEKLDVLQKKYDELYKAVEQGDKYMYHKYDPMTGDRTYKIFTKDEALQEQLNLITKRVDDYELRMASLRSEKDWEIEYKDYYENMKKRVALETFKARCEKSKLFWLIKLFNNL